MPLRRNQLHGVRKAPDKDLVRIMCVRSSLPKANIMKCYRAQIAHQAMFRYR